MDRIDLELPRVLKKDAKLTTKEIGVASVFTTKNYGRLVATPLCREAHFNACHRMIPFFPIGTSSIIFFQAIGKGKKASLISIGRELILFIPLILILPLQYGISGIYYSIVIENFLYFILLFLLTSFEFKKMKLTETVLT